MASYEWPLAQYLKNIYFGQALFLISRYRYIVIIDKSSIIIIVVTNGKFKFEITSALKKNYSCLN